MMHLMDLDVGQVDFNVEVMGVEIFYVKEGKREEFEEQVKRYGRVGGWYVFKGVPVAPRITPSDEEELVIIRVQKERAEKAMGEKVPDVWVGISDSTGNEQREEFREWTKDLVERHMNGEWENYLEGRKDAPLGGIDMS